MKKLVTSMMSILLMSCIMVGAIDFGNNITIYDGSSKTVTEWYGQQEDQEIETGNLIGQEWDMEGFFLDNSTLTMVGGYDLINGEHGFITGDIFIDINGDYGDNNNTYGYDYVLDLNVNNMSYTVYQLNNQSILDKPYYSMNYNSNPWRYRSGGTYVTDGNMNYLETLTSSDVGFVGMSHNSLSVDLSFLPNNQDFVAHYTMECGNDNLMGKSIVSVPDYGSTLLLLSLALIPMIFFKAKYIKSILTIGLLILSIASNSMVITYDFYKITDNSSMNLSSQFSLDVLEYNDSALFYLQNLGPIESTITAVYVDDGMNQVLLDLSYIDNSSAGVSFSEGATPNNLPGGNAITPKFVAERELSSDSDSPSGGLYGNGVNPNEYLGLIFSYYGNNSYNDLISDINSGDLRVGLHVQSIGDNGDSDSYVSGKSHQVPEAGSILMLLGIGMIGVEFLRRKFSIR